MLKGKKKALAAQVLLGLMVAGNAYAADRTDGDIRNPGVTINTARHLAIIGNPAIRNIELTLTTITKHSTISIVSHEVE